MLKQKLKKKNCVKNNDVLLPGFFEEGLKKIYSIWDDGMIYL